MKANNISDPHVIWRRCRHVPLLGTGDTRCNIWLRGWSPFEIGKEETARCRCFNFLSASPNTFLLQPPFPSFNCPKFWGSSRESQHSFRCAHSGRAGHTASAHDIARISFSTSAGYKKARINRSATFMQEFDNDKGLTRSPYTRFLLLEEALGFY